MFFQIKRSNFAFVNQLARHIEILLLKNDCVIVPGLGGFTASHVQSAYDRSDCMFLPPTRTLGFNPKLNINDSLLVHSYSEVYDLSYPDAFNRIKGEVEEIKQEIEYEGSYELNDIGTLYNNEGRIEFTPCEAGLLTPELYSLSSFEIKSIHNQEEQQPGQLIMGKPDGAVAAIKPEQKRTQTKKRELVEGNKTTQVNNGREARRTIIIEIGVLRKVAAAVIAIIVFFLFATPISEERGLNLAGSGSLYQLLLNNAANKGNTNAGYTSINTDKVDSGLTSATVKKHPITKGKWSKEEARGSKNNKETAQAAQSESHNYFCIVLASHVTLRNANQFAKKLNEEGFNTARVLSNSKSSVKVIYGNYANSADAYSELNKLRDNEYFHEAWIHHVKN